MPKKHVPKFYITTAIDYPNALPHLGHAYEKVVADSIARWHRLRGEEVFFLTGTDEHGKKIEQAAAKAGLEPKEFVDGQVLGFKQMCSDWGISYDRFIRTTDKDHEKVSRELFQKVLAKKDIYLAKYEGLYCTGCEAFYTEKDLASGACPVHKRKPELVSEESYFFKMSKYQKKLLGFYEKNPDFIFPKRRRAEIINRVKEGLKDLSVSRTSFSWGIPLKNNPAHVIYVWFDALLNYVSGVGYGSAKFKKFWPADVHVIGKDILWFHSVIWPTMLFSMGIEPPRKVFVHGFINSSSGEKLSKSAGNIIDPIELSSKFGSDSVRYYLLREIPLGEDGNFSVDSLVERHNSELANELGNLVYRAMSLAEKRLDNVVPDAKTDSALSKKLDLEKISSHMAGLEVHNALAEIFMFVSACNKYVNDTEPWKLEGKDAQRVLYSLLDSIRVIAILISPFMPKTAESISSQLSAPLGNLSDAKFNLLVPKTRLGEKQILFHKMEKPLDEKKSREISFSVEEKLKSAGLKLSGAVIEGVSIKKKHEGLEKKLWGLKEIDLKKIGQSPHVVAYSDFHKKLGLSGQTHAVANLLGLVGESGKLPSINTAVDSYNFVSLSKGVVVGCHDLDRISGDVLAKIADGSEHFTPMGSGAEKKISAGEFVFCDGKIVLCEMDIKQCEETKVTKDSRNLFIYVQGNEKTEQGYIDRALEEICELITKYCGGKVKKIRIS